MCGSQPGGLGKRAQAHRAISCCLDPPPRSRAANWDDPAPSNLRELEHRNQGVQQLRMDRNDPAPPAFPLADPDGGLVGVKRKVLGLQRQRFGNPESGPPLEQHEQPGSWVGRGC